MLCTAGEEQGADECEVRRVSCAVSRTQLPLPLQVLPMLDMPRSFYAFVPPSVKWDRLHVFLMGLLEGGIEKVQVKCLERSLAYSRCSINTSHGSSATSLSHT